MIEGAQAGTDTVYSPIAWTLGAGTGLSAAQDADDRIVYDTTTGSLYYDADGAGGVAAIRFAVLGSTVHPVLAVEHFELIA